MKAMYKYELAELAGVSPRTFSRFIATHQPALSKMGVGKSTKLLPPKAVAYLCEAYCIALPE